MSHPPLPHPEAISLDEYRRRRQTLMASLPPGSAVLLPSATLTIRNRDSEYPFRQDSDFHYLTGFPEPDALLLLLPDREAGEVVLFCQDKDPALETWTGSRIGAAGAVEHHGMDQAFENAERKAHLATLLDGRELLYLPLDDAAALASAEAVRGELRDRQRQGARPPSGFVEVTRLIHEQRLIKSEAELALMRHAGAISALGHARAMRTARAGLHEYQLQAELEHEFRWQGASAPAYGTIVGSGANACVLHYIDNAARLEDGDLVLIDAGAEFALYAGDITRTFPVNGCFSAVQRQVYGIVLAAQQHAIEAVRPGATLSEIHQGVVRDLTRGLIELGLLEGGLEARIEDESYKRFYPHSTSHWLGLDVHDVGAYRQDGEPRPLRAGMVLTVEPGLYLPDEEDIPEELRGIGIRIEDDVAVTQSGHAVLTAGVPKQVAEIEALMAQG
ncbi:aminopeptidase P Metallo peptidase. MEROPS family M24B [Modicisalibacter ilicicola DSM 19980]|uniref:Xaa-Pro aminopeptidase n=1 Tax=Modicisalibacter ilicicola DSM 19980 TaxID=1121942 RepID=A0A1M4VQX4_9GAMM|nr:Xaa-Pro aminopeptidase [Halomonas ilicicola]SHE71275.1 aminopeptidase P Metallo peptidase. MEROPS family M24B [Halomonas ilicicola DSM 19980]